MNRNFFIILILVFVFVGINTIFYFNIYNKQLDFQTELLARQARLCGNTIETEGQRFENELNSIPYQRDFNRLFTDEEIKLKGSVNLQKLFAGYSQLINKITVLDNHNNVYSLIFDPMKNNFVSDYYESQRQVPLLERDQLKENQKKHTLTIPGFDDEGLVQSNIIVEINYNGFVDDIFGRYGHENILWQCLITEEGELISKVGHNISMKDADLKQIGGAFSEMEEGAMVHTITVDSVSTRVISVYYPVQLVKRDLGVVFSMKTDLFLRSIIIKFIIITFCSFLLLGLLLYIHFHVIKSKTKELNSQMLSQESLSKAADLLPFALILLKPDDSIHLINHSARHMLFDEEEIDKETIKELVLDASPLSVNDSVYYREFGPGSLLMIQKKSRTKFVYKIEQQAIIGDLETRILILVDVTEFETASNLDRISHIARNELLVSMSKEISIPLEQIRDAILELGKAKSTEDIASATEILNKSSALLSNLINSTIEFAGRKAVEAVTQDIPFLLGPEINLALEVFKENSSRTSIITKIRDNVPHRLIGDPFMFRQVIFKLVENAFEQTSEGRILISAELLEHYPGHLILQFQVDDTGKGLSLKRIEELMVYEAGENIPGKPKDKFMLRLAKARQQIELMGGQLRIESPSSISTNPDQPGVKYTFTIDVIPGESLKENIIFSDVRKPENINCLVLSKNKESENPTLKPLLDMGMNVKYLVYREENKESLYELVAEKASELHMLIIICSQTNDGLLISNELVRMGITENLLSIVLSSDPGPDNSYRCRNAALDFFIEVPRETHRLYKLLSKYFPGLPEESLKNIPGIKQINSGLSILLAEDNLFNQKVMQAMFKHMGLEIDLAENGKVALEKLKGGKYDVVFMDLLMPEMDGLRTAIEMRKSGITTPIIALTAVESADSKNAAREAGFHDYLIKPANEESLRNILYTLFP